MNTQAAVLITEFGVEVALQHVNIDIQIEGLVSKVDVKQTYRNNENVNIEAVYTFPLPIDAVLLNLSVTIGERTLEGVVVEKKEAEKEYEEAITDGDTAIMLEQLGSGLYTMNVGNLDAGETATIHFNYGMLNKWQGDQLRFFLPMTLAPRYGDPIKAGLAPHQIPVSDFFVENKFSLTMMVAGMLADANIECPSHNVIINDEGDKTYLSLVAEQGFMDKDFIVLLKPQQAQTSMAMSCQDGESQLVIASFNPIFESDIEDKAHSVNIVVDCSGSMTGVSIQQAKNALERILNSLSSQDYFNIIAFGNHTEILFKNQRKALSKNIDQAKQFVKKLDADMGGTEMLNALDIAYLSSCEDPLVQKNILLITDGEIWDSEGIIKEATHSKHHIFTVGVGTAVSEQFLSELAEKTGGASEFVSPNEDMSDNIVRHFQRIYMPRAENIAIQWGSVPERQYPATVKTVFSGDTIHLFGWFKKTIGKNVSLEFSSNNIKQQFTASVRPLNTDNLIAFDLPRLAINSVLHECESGEAEQLALQYQLISQKTNYLIIDKRVDGDKLENLPKLHQVPHMRSFGIDFDILSCSLDYNILTGIEQVDNSSLLSHETNDIYLDIPAFLDKKTANDEEQDVSEIINNCSIEDILNLKSLDDLEALLGGTSVIKDLRSLLKHNANSLKKLLQMVEAKLDLDEETILSLFVPKNESAIVFCYLCILKIERSIDLDREQKRAIEKGYKLYAYTNSDSEQIKIIIKQLIKEYGEFKCQLTKRQAKKSRQMRQRANLAVKRDPHGTKKISRNLEKALRKEKALITQVNKKISSSSEIKKEIKRLKEQLNSGKFDMPNLARRIIQEFMQELSDRRSRWRGRVTGGATGLKK